MCLQLLSDVFEADCFTPHQKLVMMHLADNAGDEGRVVMNMEERDWQRLEKRTSLRRDVIRRHLEALHAAGYLSEEYMKGIGRVWTVRVAAD